MRSGGTYTPSGEYGPYSPDGIGLTISGSVDYNFTTYSASFNLVANEESKVGGFFTYGTGLSTSLIGGGIGTSFDFIDTYGGSTVFDGVSGYSKGGGFNYLGVSQSKSAETNESGQFGISPQGVTTTSLQVNFKPGTGANYGITNTKRIF